MTHLSHFSSTWGKILFTFCVRGKYTYLCSPCFTFLTTLVCWLICVFLSGLTRLILLKRWSNPVEQDWRIHSSEETNSRVVYVTNQPGTYILPHSKAQRSFICPRRIFIIIIIITQQSKRHKEIWLSSSLSLSFHLTVRRRRERRTSSVRRRVPRQW
jgi:hypothetical protein